MFFDDLIDPAMLRTGPTPGPGPKIGCAGNILEDTAPSGGLGGWGFGEPGGRLDDFPIFDGLDALEGGGGQRPMDSSGTGLPEWMFGEGDIIHTMF